MGFVQSKSSLGNTWEHPERMGIYGGVGLKLKYDTSWDWLHPVVDKIASLMPSIKIPEHLEALKNGTHGSEPYVDVISLPISSPIEDIYKAVVEFIKFYNSQSLDTIK